MNEGGECPYCEIVDALQNSCEKEVYDSLQMSIKPIQLKVTDKTGKAAAYQSKQLSLEFTLVKIVQKVAKIGKDLKYIFDELDLDGSGTCKCHNRYTNLYIVEYQEFVEGMRTRFGVYFSEEEVADLMEFLD